MGDSKQRVLAAVIERNGRYLVCQRPLDKNHGGLWEFPGGKLEAGEDLTKAAERELSEELSLSTEVVGKLQIAFEDNVSGFLICFTPVVVSGEPELHEHLELRWANLEELAEMSLAPTDRLFVQHLQETLL